MIKIMIFNTIGNNSLLETIHNNFLTILELPG